MLDDLTTKKAADRLSHGYAGPLTPGPAPFACAYINGRSHDIPPLLLALDSVEDVGALLAVANGALKRGGIIDAEPKVVYTPDGTVIAKASRVTDLRPNCVLILSCGEPFDAASVPERAKHMHKVAQAEAQRLGPLVRAESTQLLPPTGTRPPPPEKRAAVPWRFSPSGKWKNEGLQQRDHYRV